MVLRLPWGSSAAVFLLAVGPVCVITAATEAPMAKMNLGDDGLMDMLFMADIGHARADQHVSITSPWPMSKCAYEGAFSLYDGLRDFVVNKGARPQAILIMGDVAYTGGDAEELNRTRAHFQTFLNGHVPLDSVFPLIGNHDVHYLGCAYVDVFSRHSMCHYGTALTAAWSAPQLSFSQWRQNWITAFPGLETRTIRPSASSGKDSPGSHDWLAPLRYNLDLSPKSSVYIIAGLISGAHALNWNGDTPADSIDGTSASSLGAECRFLRDSLEHGRKLGKAIFIYATHHAKNACDDWSLLSEVDVWLYGHVHTFWQSVDPGSTVVQERRHYPVQLLIGNGGFDEGDSDVVSFGHIREELVEATDGGGVDRVRVHFDIRDTCVSAESYCPSSSLHAIAHCWTKCKNVDGGYDGGGGPRSALPSAHGFGFTLEAPKLAPRTQDVPPLSRVGWRLQVGTWNSRWLGLDAQGRLTAGDADDAIIVFFYDGEKVTLPAQEAGESQYMARAAMNVSGHSPLIVREQDALLGAGPSFWARKGPRGHGLRPSVGVLLHFSLRSTSADNSYGDRSSSSWELVGVAWRGDKLAMDPAAHGLPVNFVQVPVMVTSSADTPEVLVI